jgi:phosphohistidine phosphatase
LLHPPAWPRWPEGLVQSLSLDTRSESIVRTLYILRHATAAASGPEGDASRPLTPAGVKEAEAVGRFMKASGLDLDGVVCSSAVRARQTAEGVLRGMESRRQAETVPELYNASGSELLRWLQDHGKDNGRLLVVAHMPGVGELLSLLTTEHDDVGRDRRGQVG